MLPTYESLGLAPAAANWPLDLCDTLDPPMGGHSAKEKRGIARWWDTVSHHPLWSALIAALLAGGIAAHSNGVFGGSSPDAHSAVRKPSNAKSQTPPLHVTFDQVAPGIYSVAFGNPIGPTP